MVPPTLTAQLTQLPILPMVPPACSRLPAAAYNFDTPEAFDQQAMLDCLTALKQGQAFDVPVYDFATHQRSSETRRVMPADVVVLEGILVLHMEVRQDG